MMGRRRSTFPRLAARGRLGVAAVALLVIGVLASVLVQVSAGVHRRPRTSVAVTARRRAATHALEVASPVSGAGLAHARAVARSFAESYLLVAYGRVRASSLTGTKAALREQLARSPAWVTPAERERHPRVVSVEAVGQAPGFVLVTAWVSDGGISTYALRFTVWEGPGGWLVSDVVGG
jgi:hypothetical protein